MYRPLFKYIINPLLDISRDKITMEYVNSLEKSQWFSPEKIRLLQDEKLKNLIRYAYNNVSYYRKIMDERELKPYDIINVSNLNKLPVLTKEIIRKNFNQLLADNFPPHKKVLTRTGGSTGEPLEFYCSVDEYRWAYAKVRRAYKWWGYEPGDKRGQIQLEKPHRTIANKVRRFFERANSFVAWEAVDDLNAFIDKLNRFNPHFISAYPSVMYSLSQSLADSTKTKIKPKAIITHSEQLYDFQKTLIQSVFNCPVYSHYESFEMQEIAAECPQHEGYHIAAENLILEIINDRDEPVSSGKEGRILNTNLINYAMPLIRYETGDVGILSERPCSCGRGLPVLSKLNGRSTDYIMTRSGKKISGLTLNFTIFAFEGVEQFQISQESYDEVVIKIVLKQNYREDQMNPLIKRIYDEYNKILGDDILIKVKFVDKIPATRFGKRRVVVSKLEK